MCFCSTNSFQNSKWYQPECCEILNITHRRIQATCPSNIYVIPFTRATSNLKNRNKMLKGVKKRKKEEEKREGKGRKKISQMCFRNKHQTTCQISLVWQGLLWVMHLFSTGPLLPVDNLVIWYNLKNQRRTRKLGVIMQRNYLKDTNKNGALKK